jgi:hypothetical protein
VRGSCREVILKTFGTGLKPQMGALFQDGLADGTVGRNIILTYNAVDTRVEAGSNTYTVTLRVVGGDEKGSLKSERVKYDHKSQGTRTQERLRWRGSAAYMKHRPVLSPERAPHKNKTVNVKQ